MSAAESDRSPDKTLGPSSMTAYLEKILKELESAQGGTDEEAEEALAELRQKMAALAAAESTTENSVPSGREAAAPPDDMQLASALDRLDDRLKDLEEQLDSADEPTKQILQQSAQLWLGDQNFATNEDDENGPFRDTSSSSASHQKKT